MRDLFLSGRIADLILALMLLEAVALAAFAPGTQRLGILFSIVAGAGIVLALRGALAGADWPWIAVALIGSLAGHAADLVHRWRFAGSLRPDPMGSLGRCE